MIIILAILLTVKHFLCDVKFQSYQMNLDKRADGWKGTKALLKHSGIHAIGTFIVVSICVAFMFNESVGAAMAVGFLVSLVDLYCHYIVDRLKVSIEKDFKVGYKTRGWWILLGFDQAAHFATYAVFIMMLWV